MRTEAPRPASGARLRVEAQHGLGAVAARPAAPLRAGTEARGGGRGPRASPAAAPPPSSSSSSPPQLTLLVMQPCGGGEEVAAAGRVLPQAAEPPGGGLMFLYEVAPGEAEEGEAEGEAAGEGAASPEELEDEEAAGGSCKSCTWAGCSETTTQVAKQRKPWMCKRHRNKMYKDKYKRKKSDQALGGSGAGAAQGGAATPGGSARAEVSDGGGASAL